MSNFGQKGDFPEFVWKQDGKVFERFGRHYVERNSSDFGGKQLIFNIFFIIVIIAAIFGGLYLINGDYKQGKVSNKEEHRQAIKEYIQKRNNPGGYDAVWDEHRCDDCKDLW